MRGRWGAAVALTSLTACIDAVALTPSFDPAPATTVYVLGVDGEGPLSAWVLGPDDPRDVAFPADGAVYALAYAEPPEQLLLPRGHVVSDPDGARPLPVPYAALAADLAYRPLAWAPASNVEALRLRFTLPEASTTECVSAGACLSVVDDNPTCTPSCEPVAIEAPRPPEPPCFAGWRDEGLYCEPEPIPEAPCPLGARYDLDLEACVEIASCPDAPYFEPPEGGPFVFVQAGGEAGDGTRARPFASLQRALLEAPAAATLLLGAGAHQVPAEMAHVAEHRRLVGLCPTETSVELEGSWWWTDGALSLSRLRLRPLTSRDAIVARSSTVTLDHVEVALASGRGIEARTSSVTIEGSAFRDPADTQSTAVRATGGTTRARRTSFEALQAVYVGRGATGALEDVVIYGGDGPSTHTITCFLCEGLHIDRARIRHPRHNGVAAIGARTATIADLAVWDAPGDGAWIVACEPELHCEIEPCPEACNAASSPYTKAKLRGIFVDTSENSAVTLTGVEAIVEDLVAWDLGAAGVLGANPDGYSTRFEVHRAHVTRALNGAVQAEGLRGTMTAHVTDIYVVGTENIRHEVKPAIDFVYAEGSLERAAIRDAHFHGVAAWCAPVKISDVDVRRVEGSGIFVRPEATVELSRIYVEGAGEAGVDVDPMRPHLSSLLACNPRFDGDKWVVAEHVRTTSTSVGARVIGGARLDLDRFDSAAAEVGLKVGRGSDGHFVDGRVRGPDRGVVLPLGVKPEVHLDRVQVLDSDEPLVFE